MDLTETQLTTETVFAGRVFRVTRDSVRLPNGKTGGRDVVRAKGGVVILPLDAEGNVTLVRQFRYAHGTALLEAVAGTREPGEEPFVTAQRELREETGFTAARWDALGFIRTSPGILDERLYLFLARSLCSGAQELDADEFLCCERLPLAELGRRIAAGEVDDAKTLCIYLRATALLNKEDAHG